MYLNIAFDFLFDAQDRYEHDQPFGVLKLRAKLASTLWIRTFVLILKLTEVGVVFIDQFLEIFCAYFCHK